VAWDPKRLRAASSKQLAVGRQRSPGARQATGTGDVSILLLSHKANKCEIASNVPSVAAFELGMTIFFALMALTFVYAIARLLWRLRADDVEPAGSDGNALTRRD
jgi:hypothetical protein